MPNYLPAMNEIDKQSPLVRDSFVMPAKDHNLLAKIISRVRYQIDRDPTKNEILRISLMLADEASTEELAERLLKLEVLKRGRPRTR